MISRAGLVTQGGQSSALDYAPPGWIDVPFDSAEISNLAIHAGATSVEVRTGLWRTMRPIIDYDRCSGCSWICSTYCPDGAINVRSDGWFVAGVKDRRLLSGSLQLTRLQTADNGSESVRWESSRFPTFARIERTIELDLDWRVTTTVHRMAPAQGALTLEVPAHGIRVLTFDEVVSNSDAIAELNRLQAKARRTTP